MSFEALTRPGYAQGMAPRDGTPLHPEFWDNDVLVAACPGLGTTGLTLYDWSGGKHNAALVNQSASTWWRLANSDGGAGIVNKATSAALGAWNFGDVGTNLSAGAISLWFYATTWSADRIIFGWGGDTAWIAALRPGSSTDGTPSGGNSYMCFRIADSIFNYAVRGSTVLSLSRWFHCVFQSTGTEYQMWINGIPQTITVVAGVNDGSFTADLTKTGGTYRMYWGSAWYNNAWVQGGLYYLDDLRVYSRPISDWEAKNLYYHGRLAAYEMDYNIFQAEAAAAAAVYDVIGGCVGSKVIGA